MAEGRRRGRPTVGKRVPLGLRVTPEMKLQLDEASDRGGRSQSQEAEFRLEQSFRQEDLLPQVLTLACGSREVAGVAMMLVLCVVALGYRYDSRWVPTSHPMKGKPWLSDPRAFDQLALNVITLLNAMHPGGPRIVLTKIPKQGWGAETAKSMIRAIRGDTKSRLPEEDAIRDLLGSLVAQLKKADAKPLEIREWGPAYPVGKTTAQNLADAILSLINSSPQTPSRDEIGAVILEYMHLSEFTKAEETGDE